MTDNERERIERGLKVLQDHREFALSIKMAREVASLMLVVPDKFAAWGDQLYRAAVSVPANVSEAHGRGTVNQVVQYLRVARGSCWECLGLVYSAPDGVDVVGLADQLAAISTAIDETMLSHASGLL